MNLTRISISILSILIASLGTAQSQSKIVDKTEQAKAIQEGRRVLAILGFEGKVPFVDVVGPQAKKISLEFDGATVFIERANLLVTYVSHDKLRQSITKRTAGEAVMRRSNASWSAEGLKKAALLWPQAELQLRVATRYPESKLGSIGRMDINSNAINLEYRGTLGKRRIRVDLVFDQVTGAFLLARLVDKPKPR
jgi:preprotein translocase subunit YajC